MDDAPVGCGQRPGLPLTTERLILQPVEGKDVEALLPLISEWDVARLTSNIPHPIDTTTVSDFVAQSRERMARGEALVLTISDRQSGSIRGMIGVEWNDEHTRGEVGYWIGKPFWGQGIVSEALAALLTFAFDGIGLTDVTATAFVENARSNRVLQKAGFRQVGVRDEPLPVRERVVTMNEYLLSRTDWRLTRAAETPVLLVVAAALIDTDGRVLLAQRKATDSMANLWEFPGGKVQEGETPELALIRELKEELDIDITQSCLAPFTFASHTYETFHLLMPLYLCRTWKGTPKTIAHQAIQWVWPNRLRDWPMPPADEPLVAMLRDFL